MTSTRISKTSRTRTRTKTKKKSRTRIDPGGPQPASVDLPPVAIALGSNQGRTLEQLEGAVGALADLLEGLRLGPLYRSPADDDRPAPPYLNTAVVGYSHLGPEALLAALKRLEHRAGRRPAERHAPRPLDLDLLLYGAMISERPELTLPHPRLRHRAFVLEPLAILTPDWPVPPDGEAVATLARRARRESHLEPVAWGDLSSLAGRAVALPPSPG